MAVVAGCQEVQGACLEGWKRVRTVWRVWEGGLPWKGLRRVLEGSEGLEGLRGLRAGKRQPWTPGKNRWPWCLAAKRCKGPAWRVALERLAERLEGLRGLRQPWTPVKTDVRRVFALKRAAQGGVALKCCKRCKGPAWRVALESKGLRRVWRVWGVWWRANGSLEPP